MGRDGGQWAGRPVQLKGEFMSIFRSEYANKNKYLAYYTETRNQGLIPLSYAQWSKGGKIKTVRTKNVETELSSSGLTKSEISRLRGRKKV